MGDASYDPIGSILEVHAMVSGFLVQAVEDVPEHRMTEQPGAIVNHPAWTLSHLNAYAGTLLSMLGDSSVPSAEDDGTVRLWHDSGTRPRCVREKGRVARAIQ